jgi:hypothetical protein
VIGNALQHISQVRIRGNAIELAGANQAVDNGRPVATAVGAEVQVVLAPKHHATQGTLGRVAEDKREQLGCSSRTLDESGRFNRH